MVLNVVVIPLIRVVPDLTPGGVVVVVLQGIGGSGSVGGQGLGGSGNPADAPGAGGQNFGGSDQGASFGGDQGQDSATSIASDFEGINAEIDAAQEGGISLGFDMGSAGKGAVTGLGIAGIPGAVIGGLIGGIVGGSSVDPGTGQSAGLSGIGGGGNVGGMGGPGDHGGGPADRNEESTSHGKGGSRTSDIGAVNPNQTPKPPEVPAVTTLNPDVPILETIEQTRRKLRAMRREQFGFMQTRLAGNVMPLGVYMPELKS